MRAEFFTRIDRMFATIGELQEALDAWVAEYNTARPHQSCGGRPPVERFRLADRSLAADDTPRPTEPPARPSARRGEAPGGGVAVGERGRARSPWPGSPTRSARPTPVSRSRSWWPAGWWTSCTPGCVVATHAQRLRADQADRAPRARVARPGAGRHRRADGDPAGRQRRGGHLRRRRPTRPGGAWARASRRRDHRRRVGAAVQRRQGHPGPPDPPRPRPRNSARSPTPRAAPGGRTPPPGMSPSYRNSCRPGTGT